MDRAKNKNKFNYHYVVIFFIEFRFHVLPHIAFM